MNLNFLDKIGGPGFQRLLYKLNKYAPEILTGVGVAGVVGSTILIARASTKLSPVIGKFEEGTDIVYQNHIDLAREEYSDKEYKKDLFYAHTQLVLDLVKIYGPGVTMSVASLGAILAAHGIMRRRAVALLGAYKALESWVAAYRGRVIEELGADKDRDFALGFRTDKIKNEETGKSQTIRTLDPNTPSLYARFFDEGNENWRGDIPEYNLMFIKNHQNWANDKLRIKGYLFLSDVYDALGFERTPQSQVVGWVMDPDSGDCFVDFSIYSADAERARDFVNGLESAILLDFNVDGVIINKI